MAALWTNGKTEPDNACPIHGFEIQPGHSGCWRCEMLQRDHPEKHFWGAVMVTRFFAALVSIWDRYKPEIITVSIILIIAFSVAVSLKG